MTTPDHDADRLDDYLDRLAHGDGQPPDDLPAWLAATARAVRTQHEAPAPDPRFVARLRETLLMDASIPLPGPSLAPNPALNGTVPSRATSLPPLPLSAPDRRHRDARRHLASSATPAPVPTAIGSRRPRRGPAQRWNRLGWPIVELIGAAALIVGLVSLLMGGSGGGGLPALVPGFGQTTKVATPTATAGDVAMAQGNAGRTGEMPGPGVLTDPTVVWSKVIQTDQYPGAYLVAPVAADGTLFSVSQGESGSQVSAFDTATGTVRWQAGIMDGRLDTGVPAVSHGLLLVPVTDDLPFDSTELVYGTPGATPEPIIETGELLALDVQTGREVWRFGTGGIGYISPLVVGDVVYLSDGLGTIQAVSIDTGEEAWKSTLPVGGGVSSFATLSAADGLLYVTTNLGILYALDSKTGDEVWMTAIGGNYPTTPVVAGGTVYVGAGVYTDQSGDIGEGFTQSNPNEVTPPAQPDEPIANDVSRLYAIDASTGEVQWSADLNHLLRPAPTVTDDTVVLSGLGDNGDEIVALDAATGQNELWTIPTDGNVDASVAMADGIGYVGTFGSTFYAIDLATGDIVWSVRTAGSIGPAAFVSDGLVFMASGGESSTLYALRQSEIATPDATSDAPVDISGRPACDVEPRPALQATPIVNGSTNVPTVTLPDETPAFTLPGIDPGEYETQRPVISWDDLPVGTPATAEQVAGISDTLTQMKGCDREGNGRYLAAFYSDDYFLRPWVVWNLAFNAYLGWNAPTDATDEASVAANTRVLPDGRIALVVASPYQPEYGALFIFVEQDGQWLIDESEEINPDGIFRGG